MKTRWAWRRCSETTVSCMWKLEGGLHIPIGCIETQNWRISWNCEKLLIFHEEIIYKR
jgi:hypothetical protein